MELYVPVFIFEIAAVRSWVHVRFKNTPLVIIYDIQ